MKIWRLQAVLLTFGGMGLCYAVVGLEFNLELSAWVGISSIAGLTIAGMLNYFRTDAP